MPYQSPYAGRIGDLILRSGQIRGNAERQRGQAQAEATLGRHLAWARAGQEIGDVGSRTLGNFLQERKDAPRRKLEADLLARQQGELDAERLVEEVTARHQNNPTAVLAELREVNPRAASLYETRVGESRRASLDTLMKEIEARGKVLSAGSHLLDGVLSTWETEKKEPLPPTTIPGATWERPSKAAETYAQSVYPQLVKMAETLDPEMAAAIPQEFNPEALSAWRDAGLTESERNARRTRAVAEARLAMDQKADEREATEWWEKSLGNWARTVDDQQGWDEMLTFARVQGAPESVIQKAGVEFSPAAVKRLTGPEDAERTGNLEQEITRAALAGDMETVTLLTRVSGRLASARRDPASGQRQPVIAPEDREAMVEWVMGNPDAWNRLPADMRGDLTPDLARRGFTLPPQRDPAAVTWRATAIDRLESDLQRTLSDAATLPNARAEAQANYQRRRRGIEDSYRMRIGEPPLTDEEFRLVLEGKPIRQDETPARKNPMDEAPARELIHDRPGASRTPAPMLPMRSTSGAPPDAPRAPSRPADADAVVRERLAKEEPGEYELANGQVWIKDLNGQIRRVK